MSFSDLVLIILIIAATALILWVYDINTYTNKLHVYSQQCDNMILDNTYCKGTWLDKPVETYIVNKEVQQVSLVMKDQSDLHIFENCDIQDRKNWSCNDARTNQALTIKDGKLQFDINSDVQQITRAQWLQNKILHIIN